MQTWLSVWRGPRTNHHRYFGKTKFSFKNWLPGFIYSVKHQYPEKIFFLMINKKQTVLFLNEPMYYLSAFQLLRCHPYRQSPLGTHFQKNSSSV